jgi:hypothetical protein
MSRRTFGRRTLLWLFAAGVVAAGSTAAFGQAPPPLTTRTRALDGTIKKMSEGTNIIVVATIDGVEHAYRFAKNLVVPGSNGPSPLDGLPEGAEVAVHYRIEGDNQTVTEIDRLDDARFVVTEGKVVDVNRRRREVTIRFDNGRTERLQLTESAADALVGYDDPADARIRLYYVDHDGRKIVHYFKRTS